MPAAFTRGAMSTISVTSNLSTLERHRNHRRKRRSLLNFHFRLWNRISRYENLADEGYHKPAPLLKKPAPRDNQRSWSLRNDHSESMDLEKSKTTTNSYRSFSDDEPLLLTELQLPERMEVDEPIEEGVDAYESFEEGVDAFSLCSSTQPQLAVNASLPRPVTPDYVSTVPTTPSSAEEANLPQEQFLCTSTEANALIASTAEPCSTERPVLDESPRRPPVEPGTHKITSSPLISRKKCLRFADDVGQPLTDVHYAETMYTHEDLIWTRAIVLLLNNKKRKFEFIHVSYNIQERNPIADIVQQIPGMATDEDLKHQEYMALCRTTEFGRELINTIAIQGYNLQRDEILVAVVKGVSGNTQLTTAMPLLENKSILRAVKKAKVSGHAVKKVDSNPSKKETVAVKKKQVAPMPQEEDLDDSIPNMDISDISDESELTDSLEKSLAHDCNKSKVMMTRALNAGMMMAVVTLSIGGKRRCRTN